MKALGSKQPSRVLPRDYATAQDIISVVVKILFSTHTASAYHLLPVTPTEAATSHLFLLRTKRNANLR